MILSHPFRGIFIILQLQTSNFHVAFSLWIGISLGPLKLQCLMEEHGILSTLPHQPSDKKKKKSFYTNIISFAIQRRGERD